MIRSLLVSTAAALALTILPARAQTPEVQKVLADIKARDKGQLAVSEEDGRFLRVLIASSKTKRALEIGGASGYSAIWIAMGLRETGGQLVTIEYDPVRAKELAENVKRAGVADIRAAADDAAPVVFRAERDVLLDVVETAKSPSATLMPGWLKVRHRDGQTGFVRLSQVFGF